MPMMPKPRQRLARDANIELLKTIDDCEFDAAGISRQCATELLQVFHGKLVWPWDPSYNIDRQVTDPAFQAYPKLIAYCETFNDVKLILQYARVLQQKVTCRSGGHSTAGYSVNDQIVLDTSKLKSITVDPVAKTATVGPGTKFGSLNAALDFYKLHVPGGGCPDVCVGGYMQGGGYGFTSREFGINCDNVKSVLVMLANGDVVIAHEHVNSDLFWAIRGGTGNNFGVLLEVTYHLHDLWQIMGYGIRWSLDDAPAALVAMQSDYMRTGASARLGYMTIITLQEDGQHWLLMRGVYDGTRAEAEQALAPILSTPGAHYDIPLQQNSYADTNTLLLDTKPWEIPYVPPQAPGATIKEDKQAGYISTPVPLEQWQRVIAHFRKTPVPFNVVVIEPYGGAIETPPDGGNAFIHRNVDMDFFVDTYWVDDADQGRAVAWLNEFMDLMAPYFNGHVYQNYPRRNTPDYRRAYWGDAFANLLAIKLRYNNTDVFDFEQSISPAPSELNMPESTVSPMDQAVQVEPYSVSFDA